ncbi:hypothetical protein Patl1_30647 [Pistacia atlantica]|uniref:Uncharacterized protein n=1 Tax=Pistacia atlantica TaxID=434234 RepID=A0ACC1ADU7_9ROSI|nr:hypothetical protein Patl1_30647 [Pistacia atlantica]
MDMSNFRAGSHVAQQSRRDKLKIQQCSTSGQHLEDFAQNMEQSSVNPDLIQVRQRDAMLQQELGAAQPNNRPIMAAGDDLFHSLPLTISSQLNASSRATSDGGDFQGCRSSNWKSLVQRQTLIG